MASMDQVHKLITFQHAQDKAVDHNDLLVSNVAAAAQPNLPGLPASSNSKLQLVAIAPSLFLWDESVRTSSPPENSCSDLLSLSLSLSLSHITPRSADPYKKWKRSTNTSSTYPTRRNRHPFNSEALCHCCGQFLGSSSCACTKSAFFFSRTHNPLPETEV